MKAKFQQFWLARPPREQKILIAWALLMAIALIYFGIVGPLTTRIPQLLRNIPRLEGQVFAMRAAPQQNFGTAKKEDGDLRSTLFKSLAARQMNADLRSLSETRAELHLPAQNIDQALNLANELRQESSARVINVSIKSEAPNGPVLLVMELERK